MSLLLVKLRAALDQGARIAILIDRLDRCRWGDDYEEELDALKDATQSLLDIIRDKSLSHLQVMVLLIMDEASAQQVTKALNWTRPGPRLESRSGSRRK